MILKEFLEKNSEDFLKDGAKIIVPLFAVLVRDLRRIMNSNVSAGFNVAKSEYFEIMKLTPENVKEVNTIHFSFHVVQRIIEFDPKIENSLIVQSKSFFLNIDEIQKIAIARKHNIDIDKKSKPLWE